MSNGTRKEIGKREATIILGLFVVALAAFSVTYIKMQKGEGPRGRPSSTSGLKPGSGAPDKPGIRSSDDYLIVARRNLFTPPSQGESSKEGSAGKGAKPNLPAPPKGGFPSIPPFGGARFGPSFGPMGQGGASPGIAATGVVHINKTPYVLLEQTVQGDSSLVKVGEQAFGYTLLAITGDQVALRGPTGMLSLALGANKQDKPVIQDKAGKATETQQSPGAPPAAGIPTPPPSFSADMLTRTRSVSRGSHRWGR
ncbi:MAG: hypothetical protein HY318_12400 [Armatimonadetes bacterium]|nr:hypothetical protein [Armatimonadota bacterium]